MNKQKRKINNLLRLLSEVRTHWPIILLASVFVLLVNAGELLKPYILKVVIDDFLVGRKLESGWYSIGGLSAAYFLTVLIGSFLTAAQVMIMNGAAQDIIRRLRRQVYEHIQRMPLKSLDRYASGQLVTRGTNDIEALNEFFNDVMLGLFRDVFLLIGIVFVMLQMEWRLALVSFTIIPLILATVYYMRKLLKPVYMRIKAITGRINGFFAENISGMWLVQAFNRQKETMARFTALNTEFYKASLMRLLINSVNRPVVDVINTLAIAIIVWYGLGRIMHHTLEIGLLYAFTTYIKQFFDPILDFADKYDTIQSAETSADRVYELLDNESDQEDIRVGLPQARPAGRVEFRHVWFAYEGEQWILKDVNFVVEPGQHLALVGHTGSGKTTIINLISRFYDIQKGQILLDGVDIATIALEDLRRHVAVVLQEPFLFSGSVRENVTLWDELPDSRLDNALEVACAAPMVAALPNQLDEPVRERGIRFSVGERQLLSFARAIIRDPAILVLDEATAHVDTSTERQLQQSVENISLGRTMIVIAHRLSTIEGSDNILVLENGEILESGSHAQLMEMGAHYRALYEAQFAQAHVS